MSPGKASNACDAFSSVHVKSVKNVCEMLYILTQNRLENLTDSSLLLSLFLAEQALYYNENRSFLFVLI